MEGVFLCVFFGIFLFVCYFAFLEKKKKEERKCIVLLVITSSPGWNEAKENRIAPFAP